MLVLCSPLMYSGHCLQVTEWMEIAADYKAKVDAIEKQGASPDESTDTQPKVRKILDVLFSAAKRWG